VGAFALVGRIEAAVRKACPAPATPSPAGETEHPSPLVAAETRP